MPGAVSSFPGSKTPTWTTGQRPVNAPPGTRGYNITLGTIETLDAQGTWHQEATQDWVTQQILTAVNAEVPGPVGSLTVISVSDTTMNLGWSAPTTGGTASGYLVMVTPPSGVTFQGTGTFGPTGGLLTGLTQDTAYGIAVYATNIAGRSTPEQITETTAATVTVPGGVTNVTDSNLTPTGVTLAWGNPTSGSPPNSVAVTGSPALPTEPTPSLTGVTLSGLTPATPYTLSIVASNSAGPGTTVNFNFTTPAAITAPGPVTNLQKGTVTSALIGLTWGAPGTGGTPDAWPVTITPPGGSAMTATGTFGATGGTITGYLSNGVQTSLIAGTTYGVDVYAENSAGESTASAINVTTATSGGSQTVTGIVLSPASVPVGAAVGTIVGTLTAITSDGNALPSSPTPAYTISTGGAGFGIVNGNQVQVTTSPTTAGTVSMSVTLTSGDPTFTGNCSITVTPLSTGLLQPLSSITFKPQTPIVTAYGGQGNWGVPTPVGGIGNITWWITGDSTGWFNIKFSDSGMISGNSGYMTPGTTYGMTLNAKDGLGNTVSLPISFTPVVTGFEFDPGGGGTSVHNDQFTFYLDNSTCYDGINGQFTWINVCDPTFTGTTTVSMNDPSGHFGVSQPPGATFGPLQWPVPAGDYPVTITATNTASANVLTQSFVIHVVNEGGPTKQIEFVPLAVSSTAPVGTIVGTCYGHCPFNDAKWQLLDNAGGSLAIGSTTGVVTTFGTLTAGSVSFTAQVTDGTVPGISFSETFTLNVGQGVVLPASNLTASFTPNLDNVASTGTVATLSVTGITGNISWSMSGDGTIVDPNFFGVAKFTIVGSGSTATITHNMPLSASWNVYGIDRSDQLTVTATNGTDYCTNTFKVPVNWPATRSTITIGPGEQYSDFQAFFGIEHDNNWPNSGAKVYVYEDPNDYLNTIFNKNGLTALSGAYQIVAHPSSSKRVQINGHSAATVYTQGKYAFGSRGWDLWFQGFECWGYWDSVGNTATMDFLAGEELGSGNLRVHDAWFHDNSVGVGRLASGQKVFTTLTTSERGGQTYYGNSHNWYLQEVDKNWCHTCLFMNPSGSWTHKTRGFSNEFHFCRFMSLESGDAGQQIDCSEGGILTLYDSVIIKGPNIINGSGSVAYLLDGDVFSDWAWTHQIDIQRTTFAIIQPANQIAQGQYMPAFYTWGMPYGRSDGLPPRGTIADCSYYGHPDNYHWQGANGTSIVESGSVDLTDPPTPDLTLPTRVLTTTAAQPAANQLQFAVPVLAELDDRLDLPNATGFFTSPTWITAIDQTTGIVTLNQNAGGTVPAGTEIQFGFGMAGCSLSDPYQFGNCMLSALSGTGAEPAGNGGVSDVNNGPQIVLTRAQQWLALSVTSAIGTQLLTPAPTWYGGSSGVSTPNYTLQNVPNGRWAVNANTGQITVAAALARGVDVFTLLETNSGFWMNLFVHVTA